MKKIANRMIQLITDYTTFDSIATSSYLVFREELRGCYEMNRKLWFYMGSIASIDYYADTNLEKDAKVDIEDRPLVSNSGKENPNDR